MTYSEVAFLPWADLNTEISVGDVSFWPFDKFSEELITDIAVRDHLRLYFKCYVNTNMVPVDSVAICSIKGRDFSPFTQEEHILMRRAVNALTFSTVLPGIVRPVASDNQSWGPSDVDCFQLVFQRFTPGSDQIAISSGHVTTGGLKINEVKFQRPTWIYNGVGSNNRDLDLLKVLGSRLLSKSKSTERVFNALEWFRLAHTGGDTLSDGPRVVMMSSAFESIIQLPTYAKSGPLMEEIDKRLIGFSLRKTTATLGKKKVKVTLPAKFGLDFYQLRNSIVHGEKLKQSKLLFSNRQLKAENRLKWITKLIVADLLLYEIVWSSIGPSSNQSVLSWKFNSIHEALGWQK